MNSKNLSVPPTILSAGHETDVDECNHQAKGKWAEYTDILPCQQGLTVYEDNHELKCVGNEILIRASLTRGLKITILGSHPTPASEVVWTTDHNILVENSLFPDAAQTET